MGKDHRGQPSGINKSNDDTGIPAGKFVEDEKYDQERTDNYTDSESAIAESVRQNNPNRNVDKDDATTAGSCQN